MVSYPKQQGRQRQTRHPQSILHQKDGTCYICMMRGDYQQHGYLEEHHIFPGNPGRRISEEHGLKVWLCAEHHRTGRAAVHNNAYLMRRLQMEAQAAWEREHTRDEWMQLMGRNYRDDEG